MSRQWKRVQGLPLSQKMALSFIMLVLVLGTATALFSIYPGGWQTTGNMTKINTTGNSYTTGSVISKSFTTDPKSYVADSNGGEFKSIYNNAAGTDLSIHVNVPSGPADVRVQLGNVYHVDSEYKRTTDDKLKINEFMMVDPSNSSNVYYFEEYYYALDISFSTLAQILEDDGTLYNIHVHEGQTAGSFGTSVKADIYVTFKVDKSWVLSLLPADQRVVDESGFTGAYKDAFVGIMNAWYANPKSGYTSEFKEVNTESERSFNGFVKGAPTSGSAVDMFYTTEQKYSGETYSNEFHTTDIPTEISVKVYSGEMLAGAYTQSKDWGGFLWATNWQRSLIQAVDVESKFTVIFDVLVSKGYTIYTGNPPAMDDRFDFAELNPPYVGAFPWWAWVIVFVFGVIILLKVVPAALNSRGGRRR